MVRLFVDEERNVKRKRLGNSLQVLGRTIDSVALARAVDAKLKIGGSGRGGRPPYPPTGLMIRLQVVQQMYTLSDDALEYPVLDRASFQRFAELEKSSRIPDAKTMWVWRERLKQRDLIGAIRACA